jgi:hypothetical protein
MPLLPAVVNWPKYLVTAALPIWRTERNDPAPQSEHGQLRTRARLRSTHRAGDVGLDRAAREAQPIGDLLVAETVDEQTADRSLRARVGSGRFAVQTSLTRTVRTSPHQYQAGK